MQTRVDAEIVIYSSRGQKPGYQIFKVQDFRQRVVKYKQLSITGNQKLQTRTRQNQNRETNGCLIQYLTKLAYKKLAQNK